MVSPADDPAIKDRTSGSIAADYLKAMGLDNKFIYI